MLKVIFPCRRRADLDRDTYARRVLEGHVPLALKHHPTMRRYVVNLVERAPDEGPALDSIAFLHFDSLEDYRERLYDSPEGREIIGRDARGFLGGADAYAAREIVHRDAPAPIPSGERTPGLKWLLFVRRRPELSADDFLEHWHGTHVPLVLERLPSLRRYVTSPIEERLSETGDDWDGVAELWWEDRDAARKALRAAGDAIDADTAKFVARVRAYTVAEYVQK